MAPTAPAERHGIDESTAESFRSSGAVTKAGALAAGAVVAASALLGGAMAMPAPGVVPRAAALVRHDIALTAGSDSLIDFNLQGFLNFLGIGDFKDLLSSIEVPSGDSPLTLDSTVSTLLNDVFPDAETLGKLFDGAHVPLVDPLYSSVSTTESLLGSPTFTIDGASVASPFRYDGPDTAADGTPIGNVPIDDLVDWVLGSPGAGTHSLSDLFSALDLNWLLTMDVGAGITVQDAINTLGATLEDYNIDSGLSGHPALSMSSSIDDWLSGLVKVPTTEVSVHHAFGSPTAGADADTLGQYLQTISVNPDPSDSSSSTVNLAASDLQTLTGLNPDETWTAYLAGLSVSSGGVFGTHADLGDETIGQFLNSFLPAGAPDTDDVGADTAITDYLTDIGLLLPS